MAYSTQTNISAMYAVGLHLYTKIVHGYSACNEVLSCPSACVATNVHCVYLQAQVQELTKQREDALENFTKLHGENQELKVMRAQ